MARLYSPVGNFARSRRESANPNLWDGLAALWCPAVFGSTSMLEDLSGNKNHGTWNNIDNTNFKLTKYGNVLDIATNEYATISNSPSLTLTGTMPFLMWALAYPTTQTQNVLFGNCQANYPWNGIWFMSSHNTYLAGAPMFGFSDTSNDTIVRTTSAVSINAWHSYIGYSNGSASAAGLSIYIDGVLPPLTVAFNAVSSGPLTTGAWGVGCGDYGTYPFNGYIVICGLIRRAVSKQEIMQLSIDPFAPLRKRKLTISLNNTVAISTQSIQSYYNRRFRL